MTSPTEEDIFISTKKGGKIFLDTLDVTNSLLAGTAFADREKKPQNTQADDDYSLTYKYPETKSYANVSDQVLQDKKPKETKETKQRSIPKLRQKQFANQDTQAKQTAFGSVLHMKKFRLKGRINKGFASDDFNNIQSEINRSKPNPLKSSRSTGQEGRQDSQDSTNSVKKQYRISKNFRERKTLKLIASPEMVAKIKGFHKAHRVGTTVPVSSVNKDRPLLDRLSKENEMVGTATNRGLRATDSVLSMAGKAVTSGFSADAREAYAPAGSTLKLSKSVLLRPKKAPKTATREIGNSFKASLSKDAKDSFSLVSTGVEGVVKTSKAIAKTAKTTKNTVRIAKRAGKVALATGKFAAKAVKLLKLAKIAFAVGKLGAKVVKAAASIGIKAVKAISAALTGTALIKAIKVVAVVLLVAAIVSGIVILVSWLFSLGSADAETEQLVGYARHIRQLDESVNNEITYLSISADEVRFINTHGDAHHTVSHLHTDIHHLFALFLVKHDFNWAYEEGRSVLDDITTLWGLMHYFSAVWVYEEHPIGVRIYDEYGGYSYETSYEIHRVIYIQLVIFSLEEMTVSLGFGQNQAALVVEIIALNLIWELHEQLRPYLISITHTRPPQEIAYVLEGLEISWPTHHRNISSPFGWRYLNGERNFHNGIDIPMVIGTNVFASMSGLVIQSASVGTAGHMIEIQSPCGRVRTRYLHLSQRLVGIGDFVTRGDLIALSGNSGAEATSRGHLHYDIAIDGVRFDPLYALP